jgi:hypothetical protein
MKRKRATKLNLGKLTIQNLSTVLDRDEQKRVKGGSENGQAGTTQVPIYC